MAKSNRSTWLSSAFLTLSIIIVCHYHPVNGGTSAKWMKHTHEACFKGDSHYKTKAGWRNDCKTSSTTRKYIASVITTSGRPTKIEFGNNGPFGNPRWINFITRAKEDTVTVLYNEGRHIKMESTDFQLEYFFEILTPDVESPPCYRLLNANSANITLQRSDICMNHKPGG